MANNKTISLDVATAESLFTEIEKMRKSLEVLRKKLIEFLPARYGSDLWWRKGNVQAQEEVKQGKYYFLKKVNDLDNPPEKIYHQ